MSTITGPRRTGIGIDWFRVLSGVIGLIALALLAVAVAVLLPPLASLAGSPGYLVSALVFLIALTVLAIVLTAYGSPEA